MNLLKWSEITSQAAADFLRVGGDVERIALRKCVDDWLEYIEPILAEREKKINATCLGIIYHPEVRDLSDAAKKNISAMVNTLASEI